VQRGSPLFRLGVGLERHLLDAPGSPELVDAGILGDLIDPRLERDRPVSAAQTAQGRDEDLLGDVLGTSVVPDHPEHVSADPPAVAPVELLERAVLTAPDRRNELLIGALGCRLITAVCR
jgi:hypothetical protein